MEAKEAMIQEYQEVHFPRLTSTESETSPPDPGPSAPPIDNKQKRYVIMLLRKTYPRYLTYFRQICAATLNDFVGRKRPNFYKSAAQGKGPAPPAPKQLNANNNTPISTPVVVEPYGRKPAADETIEVEIINQDPCIIVSKGEELAGVRK